VVSPVEDLLLSRSLDIFWGNSSESKTVLFALQKKIVRIMMGVKPHNSFLQITNNVFSAGLYFECYQMLPLLFVQFYVLILCDMFVFVCCVFL
jgi:hypothetical protein